MKISEAADHHPAPPPAAGRTGPMAVGRALGLLQLLASPDAPCSLARLSRSLDAPKPSALSLLNELVALGYARRSGRGFELGPRAYRLGLQLLSVDSVGRLVRDGLRDLSDELGMTVALGYLDADRRALVYADRYEAAGPVRYVVQLGTPLSIHSRALGRLLLSYEPEEDWRRWLGEAPYPAFTPATTTDYASLAAELRRIRRDGLAKTASEQFEDIGSIAMPVFDAEGLVACGIAAQTAVPALEAQGARVVAALRATAALLGKALAARGIARATLARHL